MATVLEIVRVHRIMSERIEHVLKPLDLTFARYEVLMLLAFTGRKGMSIGAMGQQLQVHSTSATNAVDRLEEQGFVQRVRSKRDRRVVMVHITPAGRRMSTSATRALNKHVFTQLGLTERQGIRLWAVLRSLRANTGDFCAVGNRTHLAG